MNELVTKETLSTVLENYDKKKGRPVQPVSVLPVASIENRLYSINHSYSLTKEKTTTPANIIGSYTTMYSAGKYAVDSIYTLSVEGKTVGSFFVSGSSVSLYTNRDCTELIDLTLTTSTIKTWAIVETVTHKDYYVGNKTEQTLTKIANVNQVEDFFIRKEQKGSAGGVAVLDENGKIPLDELNFNTLVYMGLSANLTAATARVTSPVNGMFFISSEEQLYEDVVYYSGDWCIYNNGAWSRQANVNVVSSVNGKVGEINLTGSDVTMSSEDARSIQSAIAALEEQTPATIKDTSASVNTCYSSSKTEELLNEKAEINDTAESSSEVFSSTETMKNIVGVFLSRENISNVYRFTFSNPIKVNIGTVIKCFFNTACVSDSTTEPTGKQVFIKANATQYFPIKVVQNGQLIDLPYHKVTISVDGIQANRYWWFRQNTTMELIFNGSAWVVMGNPDVFAYQASDGSVSCSIKSDGLIEQWGKSSNVSGQETINLPIELSSSDYDVKIEVNDQKTTASSLAQGQFWQTNLFGFTTKSFVMVKLYHNNGTGNNATNIPRRWSVKSF